MRPRSIQVKLVNDKLPQNVSPSQPIDYEEVVITMVAGIGVLMLTYLAADTTRQIIVHTAMVKIK